MIGEAHESRCLVVAVRSGRKQRTRDSQLTTAWIAMAVHAVPVPVVLRRSAEPSLVPKWNSALSCASQDSWRGRCRMASRLTAEKPPSQSLCEVEGFYSTKFWRFALNSACGIRLPERDQENLFCHYTIYSLIAGGIGPTSCRGAGT